MCEQRLTVLLFLLLGMGMFITFLISYILLLRKERNKMYTQNEVVAVISKFSELPEPLRVSEFVKWINIMLYKDGS